MQKLPTKPFQKNSKEKAHVSPYGSPYEKNGDKEEWSEVKMTKKGHAWMIWGKYAKDGTPDSIDKYKSFFL